MSITSWYGRAENETIIQKQFRKLFIFVWLIAIIAKSFYYYTGLEKGNDHSSSQNRNGRAITALSTEQKQM